MSDAHAAVATLAARQHALFTRAQAVAAGLTRHQLTRGVDNGRYERLANGLYRIAGTADSWEQRLMGAVLAGGAGALASHRSAACLWNLDGYQVGPVEISVPRHRRPSRRLGAIVHESTDLDLAEPILHFGIPTTGLVRTLVDLGCEVTPKRLVQAVDSAIRRRSTTWEQIAAVRSRHARRGRNGVGRLRELLEERYGTTIPDSHFGRLVTDLLVDAGLPRPELEHDVHTATGEWIARVDAAYPEEKVAVELDGKAFHMTEEAFERDRPRQNRLELAGWLVLRYTWAFYSRHASRLCDEVARALAVRKLR